LRGFRDKTWFVDKIESLGTELFSTRYLFDYFQDLDRTETALIESQMICSYHLIVVVSLSTRVLLWINEVVLCGVNN